MTVNTCNHHIVPYIEFSTIIQKRSVEVLLQNVCSHAAVVKFLFVFYDALYLLQSTADGDTVPSIGEFSRFYDPDISDFVRRFLILFTLFRFFIEVLKKFEVLFIFKSMLNMECKWKILKSLLSITFIILFHGSEQSFFITQDVVSGQMIMDFYFLFLFLLCCRVID